jgi:hypothetical protein
MGAVARIERPGFALLVALGLGGCFGSHTPYVGANESLKLFGDHGEATRVHIGAGPSEDVEFRWTGDSYELFDDSGRRDPAFYRLAPLRDAWMITQRTERGVAEYGLARREGTRLWTYAPQCRDLSEADRRAVGVNMQPNGSCWVSSPAQLRGALQSLLPRNPKPDGYYELQK